MKRTNPSALVRNGRFAVSCTVPKRFWLGIVTALIVSMLSVIALGYQSITLNRRLSEDQSRIEAIASRITQELGAAVTTAEFGAFRAHLEGGLASTADRIADLETSAEAVSRAIAGASSSIVFLQGAYGFVEADSGRPLRQVLGPNGQPLRSPTGPALSVDGTGAEVEKRFTGTAFVATSDKLLLTNRHVAVPWEKKATTESFAKQGLVPVMRRFVGYLPGMEEAFDVKPVRISDDADIAVLSSEAIPADTPHLTLNPNPPKLGDEVIVMGYPTGIRALLARIDQRRLNALTAGEGISFWEVGRELSKDSYIKPLSTRGMVGQVTSAAIVYDAETAPGGSGGPVLGLDGTVVAINAAILPEFGGSNLGVPVEPIERLLLVNALDRLRQELAGATTRALPDAAAIAN